MRDTTSDLVREFSQATRLMVRNPRFFLITILVLSLGIGMSTALFSVMYGVLLRPLPVQQQDRLVVGWKGDRSDVAHVGELSYPEFQDWQHQSSAFEKMAAMPTTVYGYGLALTGYGEPVELERTPVTAAFFTLLGAHPTLGRTFQEPDDRPGAEPTVVLHYSLWKNLFHADPSVIGKTVSLSGQGYTVIGVMAPDFDFPAGAQIWTPLGLDAQWMNRNATFLQIVGRIKPGISLPQARKDIARVMTHVAGQFPRYSEPGEFAVVTPLADYVFGSDKPAILLLWAASLLLLTIACINITSLLLARAIVREKEIAIRLALGATKRRLLRQFVSEGLVLSSAGVVAGCVVARILIALVHALAPPEIPRISSVNLNIFSLLFASFVSVAIAVGFGLAPTLLMMRRDVRDSLNEGGSRAAGSRRGAFLRKSLLVSEAMVTMLLLASAGMVVHNFYNLQRAELGFIPENVLTAQIRLTNADAPQRKAFFTDLLSRLQSHSEVTAAGAVLLRPLEGNIGWDVQYQARGQDAYDAKRNPISNFEVITPDYFRAVGTPLLAGRYFTQDDRDPNQKVVIVSNSLARRNFGDVQRAIGRQIRLGCADALDQTSGWSTIIGVVADAQYRKLGITQEDIFVPLHQTNIPLRYVAIRTKVSPVSFAPVLSREVAAIDKILAVSKARTMEQLITDAKVGPRFSMLLFFMFGVFAIFLASVGVYGLVSDSVVQRRREIGIRMALGAQRRSVVYLVTQGEMSSVILGGFVGLVFSVGLAHVYAHLLYGLQGIDFRSVAAAFAVLFLVSLTTGIVPTLIATQVPLANLLVE
jgi:putative ABC transport system permease protein